MRQGKSALSHLQMLDEQQRLNESAMMRESLPAGSVKEQLEALMSQLGFEAHKAEAVLADNNDQEKKRIDEYYDNV